MKNTHFGILFILITNLMYSQGFVGKLTDISNEQELEFQSVEKSMKLMKANEIDNYKIREINSKEFDTIKKPIAYLIQDFNKPETYLIEDFNNKIGTISIAIKNNDEFKVYELFPANKNPNDTLYFDKKNDGFGFLSMSAPAIKEIKRVKLDKSKSEELIIKFSYQHVGCFDCNQSQATTTNGYILFDFDKLQLLKLINFHNTSLAQQLMFFQNFENFKIEFKENYVKMKNRKYFYKDNKLIRK
ncbi:hypothetical protein [Flavobacterium microcysteis]